MDGDIDPVTAARQWQQSLAARAEDQDIGFGMLLHALLEIIDAYQAQDMAATDVVVKCMETRYCVEILQPFGGWEQASMARNSLETTYEMRELLRSRWPDDRFRIVRHTHTVVVVEQDQEPQEKEGDTST